MDRAAPQREALTGPSAAPAPAPESPPRRSRLARMRWLVGLVASRSLQLFVAVGMAFGLYFAPMTPLFLALMGFHHLPEDLPVSGDGGESGEGYVAISFDEVDVENIGQAALGAPDAAAATDAVVDAADLEGDEPAIEAAPTSRAASRPIRTGSQANRPRAAGAASGDVAGADLESGASSTGKGKGKKPCPPPSDAVTQVSDDKWRVQRDLLEFYAAHPGKLDNLGMVWTHEGDDGKPDGFRIGVPRCGVLRQAGFRSGDIVHTINGRKVNNLVQAVAAYIALRNQKELEVAITRKGQRMVLRYRVV